MASYSATLNLAALHSDTQDSTVVHLFAVDSDVLDSATMDPAATLNPATTDPAALNSVRSWGGLGSDGCSGVLKRQGNSWKRVTILMNVLVVVVVVVALVIGLTTTQPPAAALPAPPPPLYDSIPGNATAVLPLTFDERHVQQWQKVRALPGCWLVKENIKIMDVLGMHPFDEVLKGTLLTHNILVTHCRGFCEGHTRCLSTHAENESFVVKYLDKYGALQYAERQVQNHLRCQCQEA